MTDAHWEACNSLDIALHRIDAILEGASKIREGCTNLAQETDLLALAQEQVKEAERFLQVMNEEYRKLTKKREG